MPEGLGFRSSSFSSSLFIRSPISFYQAGEFMKNYLVFGIVLSSVMSFGCSHSVRVSSKGENSSNRGIASSLQKYDCGSFRIHFEFEDNGKATYIGPRGRKCELLEVTNNPNYDYKNKEDSEFRGYVPTQQGGCAGPEGIRTIASIRISPSPRVERRVFIDQPDGGTSPYLCSRE